ncbi:hypothetical protein FKW77_001564 [Venturia effusa]|uniref:J domain-containing protein n=1 Tax=Venturia effusa TaxID=50376 RepID=A0A517KZ26_9PEZI|nr:hypothetical protein FKW77_001564 [Venturia effusa]
MDETIPEPEPPKEPDYYTDLGLQQTATFAEIKRAHHSLAKKHHPDKQAPGKCNDAHEFRRTREAYEVLRDSSKRLMYDKHYPQLRDQWVQYRAWQETQHRREERRRQAEEARRLAEEKQAAKELAEQEAKAAEEREARRKAEAERHAREKELKERLAEERSREAARKARERQEQTARARLHLQKQMEAERRSEEAMQRARLEREIAAEERLKTIRIEEKQDAVRQNWTSMREAAEHRQAEPKQPVTQHHAADCVHPRLA